MLFKDKNLPFGAPQTLEFRNFPYVFQWSETECYKLLKLNLKDLLVIATPFTVA
jgi:hypothetical protein